LTLRCGACGTGHVAGQGFCEECGAALGSAVVGAHPAQTTATPAGTLAALVPAAEMRLVSVLFVDLVGFTALSESRDAEDVRDLLGRYFAEARAVVARHGGQIEKFIGDAVMAVWGAPVAREDDAERAVRAALEVVEAVAALRDELDAPGLAVRAGVVTGRAAALERSDEGIVVGDRVNTAARVQSAAPPGAVLVDAVTRQVTAAAVVYVDGGEHVLKGKAQPLRCWRAVRVVSRRGDTEAEQGIEAPLTGRDGELRLVTELFDRTVERRAARLVVVSAEAGLGKSRLRREFARYGDGLAETVLWHTGRCLSYGEGVAFWALGEMVRQRLEIAEQAGIAEGRAKLAAGVGRWVPHDRDRALVERSLGALLGVADPGLARGELFAGWRLFFESLAAHQPVVLVFEDLQWADAGLLDFIELVLDWSSDVPIFLLALTRLEMVCGRQGWPSGRRGATLVTLEPLAEPEVRALLAGLVDLPEAAARRIVDHAEGVPLYLTETVRALADRGVLADRGGRLALDGELGELDVPASLGALLAARLDALSSEERGLAKAMSVFGGAFPRSAASALGGIGEDRLDVVLSALVRGGVFAIRADPLSPDRGQYAFAQQLMRAVAYDLLARRERKAGHLAAAAHLRRVMPNDGEDVAEVIAAHMLDAHRAAVSDPDAAELATETVTALRRAGRRAMQVGAPDAAERSYRTATELAASESERAELTYLAGDSARRAGRMKDAEELLDAAAAAHASAGRIRELALTTSRLTLVLVALARPRAAVERAEVVLSQAAGLDDANVILATLRRTVAYAQTMMGDVGRAETLLDAALATLVSEYRRAEGPLDATLAALIADYDRPATRLDAVPVPADVIDIRYELGAALTNAGTVCVYSGRPHEARTKFDGALALAERHGLLASAGMARLNAGDLGWLWDQPEGFKESAAAVVITRRMGDRDLEAAAATNLIFVSVLRGRMDEIDHLRSTLPPTAGEALWLALALALVHAQRGELDEARAALAPAAAIEQDHLEMYASRVAVDTVIAHAAGEPDRALKMGLAVLPRAIAGLTPASDGVRLGWPPTFDAAVALDRLDDARSLLALLADQPADRVPPFLAAQLTRGRGLLAAAEGATTNAEAHLRAAAANFETLDYPYWLAVTQAEHATVLHASGHAAQANTLLEQATATLTRLKATPALTRVRTASGSDGGTAATASPAGMGATELGPQATGS
jgi:class 3 adenylate cyclase/tetratricopeptide (TPR) repeat protein